MIRGLISVCTVCLLALLLVYSLAEREPRADFTYVNPSGIHTLDPARMSWTQDLRVALNIWEGLTSYDPKTLEPIEGAAHHPPKVSDDGLTYTFTIRGDGRWSNGDPVTAGDFVRAWRRAIEPGTAADYAFLLTDRVVGASAYAAWRNQGVGVLAPLSRLAGGWRIDEDQVRALVADPAVRERVAVVGVPVPDGDHDPSAWSVFAEAINDAKLAWPGIHEEIFARHAGQLDAEFSKVGLETPDEHTLVVRLTEPCPFFLDLTAFPVLSPCHKSIERLRRRHRGAAITAEGLVVYDSQWTKPDYHAGGYPGLITNGPYRLADWKFKRRARLVVNPFFRDAKAIACRTVDMLVYDDVNAAIMAYEAGLVDFLPSMDVAYDHEIARLAMTGERTDFHRCALSATYFMNFNCASESVAGRENPCRDRRVRKALSLAVDKRAIVEDVLKRGDIVAHSFVPPGAMPQYDPPMGPTVDIDEARRLLAEAGYPGGEGMPPVDILYTVRDERVCQAVARMWSRNLGIKVELRGKESKTFGEDKANRRYIVARGNWYADYNDPTTFLECLATGNGNNDSGYSNARYDALLAEAKLTTDRSDRSELLRRAEAIIVQEDFPILPILHYTAPIAIQPWVRGLHPNARMVFPFRYVWIDESALGGNR